MTTYDRTYEYRADFDGHEFAGHVIASDIRAAIDAIGFQADRAGASTVDVRLLAEVKRTTCCQRGDWTGVDHQPAPAFLYVPHTSRHAFRGETKTIILPEANPETYLWQCDYCGTVGTAAELNGESR